MRDMTVGSNNQVVDCARSPDHLAPFERHTSYVGSAELPEWPEENRAAMARGRSVLHSLAMDPTRFTSGDLCGLLLELFQEAGLPEEVPLNSVKRLILAVREHMYDVSYHNFFHAFDVFQTTYVLATTTSIMERLDQWERFALLAAALCHDLEHPGVGTGFVESAAIGDAFRDKLLEKHHTLRAFEIMADSEIGVLRGISTARYYAFRQAVSGCILATCPANHREFVTKLATLAGEGGAATKQFEMELLLRAADISNVIKPFPVAARWALRVTDEFFLQGDVERQHGMLVTPLCDRAQQSRVAMQKGFMDNVCVPFFDTLATLYPAMRPAVCVMHANRAQWGRYSDARLELLRDHNIDENSDHDQDSVDLCISSTLSDDVSTASYIFGARPSEHAPPPPSPSLSRSHSPPPHLSVDLCTFRPPLSPPRLDMHTASLPPGLSHTMSRRENDMGTSRRQQHIAHLEKMSISPTRTSRLRAQEEDGDVPMSPWTSRRQQHIAHLEEMSISPTRTSRRPDASSARTSPPRDDVEATARGLMNPRPREHEEDGVGAASIHDVAEESTSPEQGLQRHPEAGSPQRGRGPRSPELFERAASV